MTARFQAALRRRLAADGGQDEGFTLIEVLFAFLLVGICLAVGIPYLLGLQRNSNDSAAKQELAKVSVAEQVYITAGAGATSGDYGTLAQIKADPQSKYLPGSSIFGGDPTIVYTPGTAGAAGTVMSWTATVQSKTHKFFRMTSEKAEAYEVDSLTAADPLP